MDIVERVARAICETERVVLPGAGPLREMYIAQARNALAAVREPTEAMVVVAAREYGLVELTRQDVREGWPKIIDAALSESTNTQQR